MTAIPLTLNPVQQELLQFNFPVGNAGLVSVGAFLNGLLTVVFPIGTFLESILTEVQWNTALGNPANPLWILADGRNIAGSALANLSGYPFGNAAPNLCGIMKRGKNNGVITGNNNPDGDLALGTLTDDKFESHLHTYTTGGPFVTVANAIGPGLGTAFASPFPPNPTGNTGDNQTAPKTMTVNHFIRIN